MRIWQDKPVPESMIKQVLKAGLWAPHSCNLQTIRYIVLRDDDAKSLFQLKHSKGSPVCIIVAQDMRPYEIFQAQNPAFNRYLECGAAVQNMLLVAHALGLGAVWMTFERNEAGEIHNKFDIPEHISLTTYIAIGWPAQVSLPHGRVPIEEALIYSS